MFDKQFQRISLFVLTLLLLGGMVYTVLLKQAQNQPVNKEAEVFDLDQILERGLLRATTNYNSTNYFIYRGEPMGFHLELLRMFASHLGVELEVFISNDLRENFDCLTEKNGCDLLALDLTVTKERKKSMQFTVPHSYTRQVLVQRAPSGGLPHSGKSARQPFIARQVELAGKTIHVQRGTAFRSRLKSLMNEIGDTIFIVERPETTEQLIEMVALGQIDYTVSDEHLARMNHVYYPRLDIRLPLSFEQQLSWGVRQGADDLLNAANEWLIDFMETREYALLYDKYYNNPRNAYRAKSAMHSYDKGEISAYDHYFMQYSQLVGWDWRLLASLAYQESRFDHDAVSVAGAFGLMQLMPGTAEAFNVEPASYVADHIRAGAAYLKQLDDILSKHITDKTERINFVLASYNVGIGHVLDARRLAEKYGKDPNVWKDHVDYFILNKSKPKYYLDPVVKFGYARGSEPYKFVYEILERFSHYRNALQG